MISVCYSRSFYVITDNSNDFPISRRLGYSCDGDKLEEADKFLLKVEGCIKLYAAVIQSPPTYPDLVCETFHP